MKTSIKTTRHVLELELTDEELCALDVICDGYLNSAHGIRLGPEDPDAYIQELAVQLRACISGVLKGGANEEGS